jgi:hypothetical protein
MFKNKRVKTIEKPFMVEPKVFNPSIQVVDVNMAITKSKVIEEQMFKDKIPIKKKSATNWKKNKYYISIC